jgi:hypothetical protein
MKTPSPLYFISGAIKETLSGKSYMAGFAAASILVTIVYAYLLSFSSLNLGNVPRILGISIYELLVSLLLGIMFSLVLTMSAFSIKRNIKSSEKVGIGALIASIVPSSMCCTALIPSVLSIAGASTATIIGVTGKIQGPFASLEPVFIIAAVVIMLIGIAQSSKRIYAGCCVK